MIDMNVLINQLIQLFLIMFTGFIAFRIKMFTPEGIKSLNKFVINITLPLMVINSVLSMDKSPSSSVLITLFIASILFYSIMPFVAFAIVKILLKTIKIVPSRQGAYMFMLIFSNVGFMGFPILQAACGENGNTAVFYAAVLNIIFNLGSFSYGVVMMGMHSTVKTTFKLKSLISPGIISSILALIVYGFHIRFPSTIESVIDTVGGLTAPLAMILVGAGLASNENVTEVFKEWKIYFFVFIKQMVLPFLLWPIFRLFISDDLLFNVLLIEMMMPVANTALIMATEYGADYKFVAKTIFLSTVMSIATIPATFYLCNLIW